MTSTTSYRLSGLALILGCVLSAFYYVTQSVFLNATDAASVTSPLALASSVVGIAGSMFVLLGLPGVYARQAGRAGVLGLLGFLCIWYVTLFQGVLIPFTTITLIPGVAARTIPLAFAMTTPSTWDAFGLLSMAGQILGILLLGIATLRAGVFPRWTAWLFLATWGLGIVSHLPFMPEAVSGLPALLSLVAMAAVGVALVRPQAGPDYRAVPAGAPAGSGA